MTSWIVLQLADSAFPTGGFAHSAGLEAHVQAGELASLERYCAELVEQVARASLPMVSTVHDAPDRLAEVDAFATTTLWSHVAARASSTQGRALLDVAARSFGHPVLLEARAQLSRRAIAGHLAPVFGFVTRALGVDRDEALASFLHLALRGALSAAVRLGVAGPTEAQRVHHALHPALEAGLATARSLTLADVAQTAPLAELIQTTHDTLYSRLFQS